MSEQPTTTTFARKKIALNNNKLALSAPLPGQKNIYSTLSVDIYKNNPRIEVATKDPNLMNKENDFGKIRAAMDAPVFYAFLELVREAADSQGPMERRIDNFNHTFEGGQRSQEIQHVSTLVVGRDQEGHIYVSVLSTKPGWAKIKFVFGVPDYRFHRFVNADGGKPSRAETSVIMARAYYTLWKEMMASCLVNHFEDIPPANGGGWKGRQGGGGGGQGGWKGGNGGQGGGGWKDRQGGGQGGGGGYQNRQGGNGGGVSGGGNNYAARNEPAQAAGADFDNFEGDGIPF